MSITSFSSGGLAVEPPALSTGLPESELSSVGVAAAEFEADVGLAEDAAWPEGVDRGASVAGATLLRLVPVLLRFAICRCSKGAMKAVAAANNLSLIKAA
jgi:hypothetical protein